MVYPGDSHGYHVADVASAYSPVATDEFRLIEIFRRMPDKKRKALLEILG